VFALGFLGTSEDFGTRDLEGRRDGSGIVIRQGADQKERDANQVDLWEQLEDRSTTGRKQRMENSNAKILSIWKAIIDL
jgi:hypothetical protein